MYQYSPRNPKAFFFNQKPHTNAVMALLEQGGNGAEIQNEQSQPPEMIGELRTLP
jgi:hypothetical protein